MTVHVTQCSMTAQVRQRLIWKMSILPQFWTPDTHEVTRGLPPAAEKFAFYYSFERPTRTKWRKGSFGEPQNLHFTTFLGVRHARSDERVARRSSKFAVYHSFERPTRTKWRQGRSASLRIFTTVLSVRHARIDVRVAPICEKFAFYHSFERPTRTKWRESCQIHRCDPCAPTEKEHILRLFQRILISSVFSAVFSLVFEDLQSFL